MQFPSYTTPNGSTESVSNVDGIVATVVNGQQVLQKDNIILQAPPLTEVLVQFSENLEKVSQSKKVMLLIAHNAHKLYCNGFWPAKMIFSA